MREMKLLFKNQGLIFYNNYLSNAKKIIKLLLISFLIASLAFVIGKYLSNNIFKALSGVDAKGIHLIVFILIFIFSMFQFVTSAQKLIPNFYKSSDIIFLLGTPLQSRNILLFKIINHTLSVIRSESLFIVPILIGLGLRLNLGGLFFLLFPVIYLLMAASATSMGALFGFLYLRKFSVKSYKAILTFINVFLYGFFWMVYVFEWFAFEQLFEVLFKPIFTDYIFYLVPAYSGAYILAYLDKIQWLHYSIVVVVFLLMTSLMIVGVASFSHSSFYKGLQKINIVTNKPKNSKSTLLPMKEYKKFNPKRTLIFYQWKMGLQNIQFIWPALIMIGLYGFSIFALLKWQVFNVQIRYIFLSISAFFFVNLGVSLPFLNSDIASNPKLEKLQYAWYKTFPVSPKDYVISEILVTTIPGAMIITLGHTIFLYFVGINIHSGFLLLVLNLILFVAYKTSNKSSILIYYSKYYDGHKFMGNIFSMIMSLLYYTCIFGLALAYYGKDYFSLSFLSIISLPMVILVGSLYILFIFLYIFKAGISAWKNTEF